MSIIQQQALNYQLQLDNFVKSSKLWNDSMAKINSDVKIYKEQIQELQQYLDWYTTTYPVDKFQLMENQIKSFEHKTNDLMSQIESYKLQSSQLTSDYQLIKLQLERVDQSNHKQQGQLNNKIYELQLLLQRQEQKDQFQQTSNKKQRKKASMPILQSTEPEQVKQTTDEDNSVIIKKVVEDTQEYENISRQIIKLEMMLDELDGKYDKIVRQAQAETDLKVKQAFRQELIQILAQIKEINQQINTLLSQQKSLKMKL